MKIVRCGWWRSCLTRDTAVAAVAAAVAAANPTKIKRIKPTIIVAMLIYRVTSDALWDAERETALTALPFSLARHFATWTTGR